MSFEKPEPLTLRGGAADIAYTIGLILGTSAVAYVRDRFPIESPLTGFVVLILEAVVAIAALVYLIAALTELWRRFSRLVEDVANSPTWPRVKRAVAWSIRALISACRTVLIVATWLVLIVVAVLVVGALMKYLDLYKYLAPILEAVARIFGQQFLFRFGNGHDGFVLPQPIQPTTFIAWIAVLAVSAWAVRGLSYIVGSPPREAR
jgi:hypothetical protein